MKTKILLLQKILFYGLFLLGTSTVASQITDNTKYYMGLSYGASFPVGDFKDDELSNPDAGFAESGNKLDLFFGFKYRPNLTATALFRYQNFAADISSIQNELERLNPDETFTSSTDDWNVYYFLIGTEYQIHISKKLDFFPRFGLGPIFITTPGFNVSSTNQFISRTRETGVGLGYEIGIGLKRNLGKHFALMPTFAFSGGFATIDQTTNTNNVIVVADYQPQITTFNLGLSLAYKF